ncbi:MAG: TRAP transporter substrate-binding protein DctP [Desulfuromonadaceae bacterium]|nr:TRAP transporter substrate-binding protein DctP [Desulfuromonadaceae bacterium]
MKKRIGLVSMFIVLAVATRGIGAQQEVITLKLADSVPVTHLNATVVAKTFIDRVTQLTNGRVKIQYFPAEQLGKQKDLLNLNSQGVADIALLPPSYLAGQLPLNTVMILPSFSTASEGTAIYSRLLASGVLANEFKRYGLKPLFVHTTPPYDVVTKSKQIKSPADLKGMKFHTSGGLYNEIAKQYGIVSVTMPGPEMYEATQRGVVEGLLLSYPAVKSYKLFEIVKYLTYGANFGCYPVVYTINEQKWQTLPEDIKKAINQASVETSKIAGEAWDKEEERLLREFKQKGIVVYELSSQEKANWRKSSSELGLLWVADMEKKGLPGKKVYEQFQKALNESKKQ